MDRQMVFEQFMDRPSEAGGRTLGQVPREQRDKLVGLLAELMSRALAPDHRKPSIDDSTQTLGTADAREVNDNE